MIDSAKYFSVLSRCRSTLGKCSAALRKVREGIESDFLWSLVAAWLPAIRAPEVTVSVMISILKFRWFAAWDRVSPEGSNRFVKCCVLCRYWEKICKSSLTLSLYMFLG
jgi:hypothetical protein